VRALGIAVLAAAMLVLAACGGNGGRVAGAKEHADFDSVFSAVDGLQGAARERRLRGLAREEGGGLTIYTSLASSNLEKVEAAFRSTYGITLSAYRAHSGDVVSRLVEEAKAGHHGADLVALNGADLPQLNAQHLLVDDRTPLAKVLVEGATAPGWTEYVSEPYVVAWNTTRVPPSQRPRSWQSLADPRWRGKLVIEDGDFDWYRTLRTYWIGHGMSAGQADRTFTAIAKNAVFVHGQSVLGQLLGSGEFDVGVSFGAFVDTLHDRGAPLGWRPPVEPVFPLPLGIGLVRGSRHPAAAALFVDWLLGPQAQRLLAKLHYEPARQGLGLPPSVATKQVDVTEPSAQQQAWSDRFDRLVRLGKAISGS
jgi:iron(III) transport system substrate-binding protein